ncbi:MAG: hypothetical protein ACI840_001701 [Ulvibacter sp.]|jgi:uncharacterized protein (DUF2141 family)
MQTIITYLTLLLTGLFMHGQNTIEVSMSGFDNNDGTAMIALYDSAESFLEKRLLGKISKIENNEAKVIFSDVPDGIYAISVVHDEDENGRLNMVMGFYPSEASGASNNAPANFGPPKWEDAKFGVKNGQLVKQNIKL